MAITAVPEVYGIPLYYLHRHVPCFCKEVSWGETGNVLEDWLPTQSPDGHRRARKVLDKDCRAVPVCPLLSTGFLFRCRHRQPTLSTHSAVVGRYRWALRSFLVTTLRYVFCQGAIGGGGLLGCDGAATAGHCNRCVGGSSPCLRHVWRPFGVHFVRSSVCARFSRRPGDGRFCGRGFWSSELTWHLASEIFIYWHRDV